MLKLIVDNREIAARPGQSVLQACLAQNIYIPHLCFMENETDLTASCRLCFVQIDGRPAPQTACTLEVADGMRVLTDTPAVRRLQRSALRFLLSVHHVDCRNCHANRACALQRIARFLKIGLKARPLETHLKEPEVDSSHPHMDYYPNRCVLCGKCIRICRSQNQLPVLTYAGRGFDTAIRYYPGGTADIADCPACGRCIAACPVGALVLR